jgi:hypothetical protein
MGSFYDICIRQLTGDAPDSRSQPIGLAYCLPIEYQPTCITLFPRCRYAEMGYLDPRSVRRSLCWRDCSTRSRRHSITP